MLWGEKTVEDLRKEFVLAAQELGNISEACRRFGITRRTGYKWLKRAREGQRLSDQSRAPSSVPNRTPLEIEALILSVRDKNPAWGGMTIREVLRRDGWTNLPSVKICNNILKRYNRVDPIEGMKRKEFIRFEREKCNELWQTDYKGDFPLLDGSRCYPLTILDDHSRFSILIHAKSDAKGAKSSFIIAFRELGLPDSVLSDNGPQFAGFNGGYTQFEWWLMDYDVLPIHGRSSHPQTQGKIERFYRTMKQELLKHHSFEDLSEANTGLQNWRHKYNHIRPHRALSLKTPGEVYTPSNRTYTDTPPKFEYSGEFLLRKVNNWGYLRFASEKVYLSETMADTYVEIRPSSNGESYNICYRNFKIAKFDPHTGTLKNRNIYRL